MGLRFLVLSGCLSACKMDTGTPKTADNDARARRAVAIILIVMGVLIVTPFFLYVLAGKGVAPRP